MDNDLETAILRALGDHPVGLPADGHQLAEKLGISPQLLREKVLEMGTLLPRYAAGLVILVDGTPQYANKPTEFLVSLQPLDEARRSS